MNGFRTLTALVLGQLLLVSGQLWAEQPGTAQWSLAGAPAGGMDSGFHFDLNRPESGLDLYAMERRQSQFATQLQRQFDENLSVDIGLSYSSKIQHNPIDYKDIFMGMNYGAVGGRVWYLDPAQSPDEGGWYYEAGWQSPVARDFSLAFQVGQGFRNGQATREVPDLSVSAFGAYRGYDLGVRVIDRSGLGMTGETDFSLMGSLRKRFP